MRNDFDFDTALFDLQDGQKLTGKVRVFPNIESLERLVSAVLVEIDDKWAAANKGYIKWENQDD